MRDLYGTGEKMLLIPESLELESKRLYPDGYFMGMKIVVQKSLRQGEWFVSANPELLKTSEGL